MWPTVIKSNNRITFCFSSCHVFACINTCTTHTHTHNNKSSQEVHKVSSSPSSFQGMKEEKSFHFGATTEKEPEHWIKTGEREIQIQLLYQKQEKRILYIKPVM
jgi:hypothetical protein